MPITHMPTATMTATPHAGERLCGLCGCVLAADDVYASACSPCRGSRNRSRYQPQHDAGLRDRLLVVLREHQGQRINVYRALGLWPCGLTEWVAVQGHVRYLRANRTTTRAGHMILGWHDGTYMYVGSVENGCGSADPSASH